MSTRNCKSKFPSCTTFWAYIHKLIRENYSSSALLMFSLISFPLGKIWTSHQVFWGIQPTPILTDLIQKIVDPVHSYVDYSFLVVRSLNFILWFQSPIWHINAFVDNPCIENHFLHDTGLVIVRVIWLISKINLCNIKTNEGNVLK